jgi:hypothetical protein
LLIDNQSVLAGVHIIERPGVATTISLALYTTCLLPSPGMNLHTPRRCLLSLAIISSALAAQAQVTFTITATNNEGTRGYAAGQDYTFIYTTAAAYALNASSVFNGSHNSWNDETWSDLPIFSSVRGTGLTGTLGIPAANEDAPWSFVNTLHSPIAGNHFAISAGADEGIIGLYSLDHTAINSVGTVLGGDFFRLPEGLIFNPLASYQDPTSYFTGYNGSYAVEGTIRMLNSTGSTFQTFSVNNLTISAIPEPSSFAALAGLGVLGFATTRCRRVQA